MRLVLSILGGRLRGLAQMVGVGSLASPGPAALIALTWNTYGSPSVRPGTVADVTPAGTVTAFSQLPNLSFTSTTYPVIGDPPSVLGGSHFKST